jgi:signal transduction histidine kinase/ActR/RegA family two-component response regulator
MKQFLFILLILNCICKSSAQSLEDSPFTKSQLISVMERVLDSSSAYYDKGNFAKSLQANIKLLELAKQIGEPKYLNKAYRFLGYDFLVINDKLLARQNFEDAKKYAEILNDDVAIGLSYMDLANYYSSAEHDYDKALINHEISIKTFRKAKDSTELAKAIYNAVISAFDADAFEDAKRFLTQLNDKRFDPFNHESFQSESYIFWSEYYNKMERYDLAEMEARKAIDLLKYTDYANKKAEAYMQLSISLAAQNDYAAAYAERMLYENFNDESVEMQQTAQSEAALASFQVEQYQIKIKDEKEKTILQAEIAENKNSLSNVLILVCLIILLLLITLLVAYNKRRELYKALKEKNKEYLAAKQRSEHLSKAKSKFFSTVSHELRTPLYGVIGLSNILLEDPALKSHEKDLKSLKFSADYLLALINNVLQINKIDESTIKNKKSSFHVLDFMESIISTFEYTKLQNNNEIKLSIDPCIPSYLYGNVTRLSQVLMNVVGNACKFTENGTISIGLTAIICKTENIQCVCFTVADNGIGIAANKQSSVFNEFTQIESLDYHYQGTGLGLPIVKKLLKASGSDITLKSELGVGSTFSFNLSFEVTIKETNDLKFVPVDETLLKDKHILIAEDNRINQMVTKKILQKKGVQCVVVENGEQAVSQIKKIEFDLVLMDLNMPVMDGFKASIEIRKFNTVIPIIALTAVEVEEVRNEISIAGMNDIIIKPYNESKFSSIIIENLTSKKNIGVTDRKAI